MALVKQVLLATALSLAIQPLMGCTRRPEMGIAGLQANLVRPAPGKALVMFIRPGRNFGRGIATSLYDGDHFIGILTHNTLVACQAEPGRHVFMLLSGQPAAPAFLEGDLLPGKTYYVDVAPRSAWTRPPFHLVVLDPGRDSEEVGTWLRDGALLVVDDRARQWDRENRASVSVKRQDGLREWNSKPEAERVTIRAGDGIEMPEVPGSVAFPVPQSASSDSATSNGATVAPRAVSERLRELESLRDQGLLTDEEYREKRRHIIEEF